MVSPVEVFKAIDSNPRCPTCGGESEVPHDPTECIARLRSSAVEQELRAIKAEQFAKDAACACIGLRALLAESGGLLVLVLNERGQPKNGIEQAERRAVRARASVLVKKITAVVNV